MKLCLRVISILLAVLLATSCGAAGDRQSVASEAAEGDPLKYDGISFELPEQWDGRTLPLGASAAVLQAANFKLLPAGIELRPGEEDPIKAMTADHVLLTVAPCGIVNDKGPGRPAPKGINLHDLSFLPAGHPRIPRGHAIAQGSFDFDERCLRIVVDFGGTHSAARLREAVNEVLASLSVSED